MPLDKFATRGKGAEGLKPAYKRVDSEVRALEEEAHPGQRGMKPSTHTLYYGVSVTNEEVVDKIKTLIRGSYNDYGYQSITNELSNFEKMFRQL